jgi:hypothetical protein
MFNCGGKMKKLVKNALIVMALANPLTVNAMDRKAIFKDVKQVVALIGRASAEVISGSSDVVNVQHMEIVRNYLNALSIWDCYSFPAARSDIINRVEKLCSPYYCSFVSTFVGIKIDFSPLKPSQEFECFDQLFKDTFSLIYSYVKRFSDRNGDAVLTKLDNLLAQNAILIAREKNLLFGRIWRKEFSTREEEIDVEKELMERCRRGYIGAMFNAFYEVYNREKSLSLK